MKKALWFIIGYFLFFSVFLGPSWAQWQIPRRGEKPAKPSHGEWLIPVFEGERPAKPPPGANLPEGKWQLPAFNEERAIKGEGGYSRILVGVEGGGAIDPDTGKFYPGIGGGLVVDPETGKVYPQFGNVYIDPGGEFIPQNVPTTSADPPVGILTPTPGGTVDQTGKFYPQIRRAPSASPPPQPVEKPDPPAYIGRGYTGRIEIGADGIARPAAD